MLQKENNMNLEINLDLLKKDEVFNLRIEDMRPMGAAMRALEIIGVPTGTTEYDRQLKILTDLLSEMISFKGPNLAPAMELPQLANASKAGVKACVGAMAGASVINEDALNLSASAWKCKVQEPDDKSWLISFAHDKKTDLCVPTPIHDMLDNQKQPFLVVDFDRKDIYTATKCRHETGWTPKQFNNIEQWYVLPYNVDALELKNWVLNNLIPEKLNEAHSRFELIWDGNKTVGKFRGKEDYTEHNLGDYIMQNAPNLGDAWQGVGGNWLGVIEASAWFEGFNRDKISVNTQDTELEKMANEEEDEANGHGKVRGSFLPYLKNMRDEKIEELLSTTEEFFLLPQNQGQIVEISHSVDYVNERVIEKRFDRSDKTTKYYAYVWEWDFENQFNHLCDELKLGDEIDL